MQQNMGMAHVSYMHMGMKLDGSNFATMKKSTTKLVSCEDNVGSFFYSNGQTINLEYYQSVLFFRVCAKVCRRPALWWDKNSALYHNNAWAYHAFYIMELLAKLKNLCASLTHYSPNTAPADFYVHYIHNVFISIFVWITWEVIDTE